MKLQGEFVTDTATMCIFDIACLKHRLEDDADWWSIPDAEIDEVNLGNVAFLNLGGDGRYSFKLAHEISPPFVEINLNVPSGRIFVGAAEEVTADGLEPDALRGGMFVTVKPGKYKLRVSRNDSEISVSLHVSHGSTINKFDRLIRI